MKLEGLEKVELNLPPMRFKAATVRASGADAAKGLDGLRQFSREQLIAAIETQHGAFSKDIDLGRLAFWRAIISNTSVDSYFTRMAKSSLAYYAADLESPTVSFQNSHRHNEFGVGRSVKGQLILTGETPEGQPQDEYFPAVVADFYSHRDLSLGSVPVEQFLLGIDTNIIKDVSIGFKENYGKDAELAPTQYTCNICRQDYWSWDCSHIAGMRYEVISEAAANSDPTNDGEGEKILCVAWVENARLSEVSGVFDGSNGDAMTIKAEREARAGRLNKDTEIFLERRFRFTRSKETTLWVAENPFTQPEPEETKPAESATENRAESNDNSNQKRLIMDKQKLRAMAGVFGLSVADETPETEETVLNSIAERLTGVATKATAYDKIRAAAIDSALAEKARVVGEKFDDTEKARVRSMLENCQTVEDIQAFESEWKGQGDTRFQQTRKTQDEAENENGDADLDVLPEATRKVVERIPFFG